MLSCLNKIDIQYVVHSLSSNQNVWKMKEKISQLNIRNSFENKLRRVVSMKMIELFVDIAIFYYEEDYDLVEW